MPAKAQIPPTNAKRPRVGRVLITVRQYLATEAASAVVLVIAAVIAVVWANLPSGDSYESFWGTRATLGVGDWAASKDLRHWVDEGLMTLFFLVVALEIKRELVDGELRGTRKAALPVIGAAGGMIVPALLYLAVNPGGPAADGWAIPVATDIAFATGVVALVAPSIPQPARVFLLSLAIVDDVGAILVIAFAYSSGLHWMPLLTAAALLSAMVGLRVANLRWLPIYVLLGAGVWLAILESGVHATIAGVLVGFVIPAPSLERFLHPWTSFLIVPIFALANAGLQIDASTIFDAATSAVTLGIVLGLVVGKPVGICLAVAIATKMGWGTLPEGTRPRDIVGLGAVAGIGFTVSLFITGLAFSDEDLVRQSTLGIAVASILAAAIGAFLLQRSGYGRGRIK